MQDIATGTLDSYLRDMVTAMVDERMGSAATRLKSEYSNDRIF